MLTKSYVCSSDKISFILNLLPFLSFGGDATRTRGGGGEKGGTYHRVRGGGKTVNRNQCVVRRESGGLF